VTILACIAVSLIVSTLAAVHWRVRSTTKGGELMDASFTVLARAVDLFAFSTAVAGIVAARVRARPAPAPLLLEAASGWS